MHRRLPLARFARGFSLVEILVVLAIIALISGVIAIAVVRHLENARKQTTRQSALALRNAIASYRIDHADDCPSIDTLVAAEIIDSVSKTNDAWDKPFVIECDEHGHVTVASGGPDKRIGTDDDIRVPEPPTRQAAGPR